MTRAVRKFINSEYFQLSIYLGAFVVALILYLLGQHTVANYIWGITAAIGVVPSIWDMIKSILKGEFGVDIIAVTAIVASLALNETLAAMVILLMLVGGEALENYAQDRARNELSELLKHAPKIAHRQAGRGFEDIPVDEVKVGDELIVRPGEIVPVDAKVTEGTTSIDESAITGEGLPVDKQPGDDLLSGTINESGLITITALKPSKESQYERIVQLVKAAASSRSPLVRLADQYSVPFTAISFGIAGLAWFFSGQPLRALEVLVVATPCPLLIATPVALVSGMSRAARYGIIVKNGAALEQLAWIKAIAFDKTGTLTVGTPEVDEVEPVGINKTELVRLAAAVEQGSVHTLAEPILQLAREHNLELERADMIKEESGRGVMGQLDSQKIVVGSPDYLAEHGVTLPEQSQKIGETAIYVGRDGSFVGSIYFRDKVRKETKTALKAIDDLGVEYTIMLTGDRLPVAKRIARQVGIRHLRAETLPIDKLNALKDLRTKYHPVGMVGDGVNDAPTLAAADVGIAMGAKGSTAASESADIVIMTDDLQQVPRAMAIAQRAIKIARQSIFVGIGLSIGLMLVASAGIIPPVIGALLQEAVDVTVILNALRAHTGQLNLPQATSIPQLKIPA